MTQDDINRHIDRFISQEARTLEHSVDMNFGDRLLRLPLETKDGSVIEATFCQGYKGEKHLAALSAQVGCASGCSFCQLGAGGCTRSLTSDELVDQLRITLQRADKMGHDIHEKPIKATFVMGGEPLANPALPTTVTRLAHELPLQLKISSIMPATTIVRETYRRLVQAAASYPAIVQYQVSLNSTDESYRQSLTRIPLQGFKDIREAGERWQTEVPHARSVDLTFTVNKETPLDPLQIVSILPPSLFAIRLREWIPTDYGRRHALETVEQDHMRQIRQRFEDAGYRTIPGSPGGLEWKYKLAPGESMAAYGYLRNKTTARVNPVATITPTSC